MVINGHSSCEALVLRALAAHADSIESANGREHGFDLCAKFGEQRVLVAVKSIAAARVDALIGRLSQGVLVGRVEAKDAIPMVIVVAPRLGPKSLDAAEQFMEAYAPDVAWGAMDERGAVRLRIPGVGLDVRERGERRASPKRALQHVPKQPFSDLNRWLAKVLVYAAHEADLHTAADLARVADVSRSKAYTFVRDFDALGYLDARNLELRQLGSLLDDWLHEDRLGPAPRVFVRGLFGRLEHPDFSGEGRVLGGFAACEHHGVLHAPYELPEVHVRDVETALDALGAGPCERRDAELALIVPPHPESVFRAAADGVVDLWQAALDVVANPARGLEQAQLIRDRLLAADES
jgi:hypothetical protein